MDKPWIQSYPPGVPPEIALDDLVCIGDYFLEAVARYPQRNAFVSGATGQALSYQSLASLSQQLAAWFQQELKLPAGSRVALMMPNLLQYPVCLLALLRAGYVVVNVNPMYTPRELEHQLKDSGASAMVVVDLFAHVLEKVIAQTNVRHTVVTGLADMMPTWKRQLAHFVIRRLKKLVRPYQLPGHTRLLDAIAQGRLHTLERVPVGPEDLAFLQYTGGTTGVSKGAMLTHRNVLANARQGKVWSDPFLDPDEELVSITAIPLYHVFALGSCLSFIGMGGTNVLVADPRDTAGFIKVLARHPFTGMPAVNTLFNDLTRHPAFAKLDFTRLRFAIGGGAAIQQAVAQRWQQITGKPLVEGYGLTECSPTVTCNPLDLKEHNGAIGLPLPSTEVSLRDAQGQPVAPGQSGELCVRGPQVMAGYWQRPQETAHIMTEDGFLRTGDLAVMDDKGFLRIVDRLKDMILVSGFNVYPNEVEEVAMLHPGVREAAAVGVPDPHSGDRVKLFVVRADPGLQEDALRAHCRRHLTGYKQPSEIEFMPELPKSQVGKILRRELRQRQANPSPEQQAAT